MTNSGRNRFEVRLFFFLIKIFFVLVVLSGSGCSIVCIPFIELVSHVVAVSCHFIILVLCFQTARSRNTFARLAFAPFMSHSATRWARECVCVCVCTVYVPLPLLLSLSYFNFKRRQFKLISLNSNIFHRLRQFFPVQTVYSRLLSFSVYLSCSCRSLHHNRHMHNNRCDELLRNYLFAHSLDSVCAQFSLFDFAWNSIDAVGNPTAGLLGVARTLSAIIIW